MKDSNDFENPLDLIKNIGDKYNNLFLGFYSYMTDQTADKLESYSRSAVIQGKQRIKKVSSYLNGMLNRKGELKPEQATILIRDMKEVEESLNTLIATEKKDLVLKEIFDKMFRDTGVSPELLRSWQVKMRGRLEKLKSGTRFERLRQGASGKLKEFGVDLIKASASQVLGPFGRPIEFGLNVGRDIYKALTKPKPKGASFDPAFGFNPFSEESMGSIGGRTSRQQSSVPASTSRTFNTDMTTALTTFFNGPAYKARWTKELLEAVQGKSKRQTLSEQATTTSGSGEFAKGALFASFLPTIKNLVLGGLATIVTVIASIGGAMLWRVFDKWTKGMNPVSQASRFWGTLAGGGKVTDAITAASTPTSPGYNEPTIQKSTSAYNAYASSGLPYSTYHGRAMEESKKVPIDTDVGVTYLKEDWIDKLNKGVQTAFETIANKLKQPSAVIDSGRDSNGSADTLLYGMNNTRQ